MISSDFTKTSRQIEREISDLIDSVDRDLDSSNGEADRKGHFVISALLSLLLFFGIFGFEHLVGQSAKADPLASIPSPAKVGLSDEALETIRVRLDRIDAQSAAIDAARIRVAPSMQIDAQIQIIGNATEDLRSILKIAKTSSPVHNGVADTARKDFGGER